MKVCVVGSGYVGLVTAACFADAGHRVIGIDHDVEKITMLNSGKIPIYEPGLHALVARNRRRGWLIFSSDLKFGVQHSQVIFICVNTPPLDTGETDLSSVFNVSKSIARWMNGYKLIVSKSTVPVETGKWIERTVRRYYKGRSGFDVASNPEFLREGTAIGDFVRPDRIVLGVESKRAERLLRALYKGTKARILVTDVRSAELIKHASNSFLANKISFVNSLARVCDAVGANIQEVTEGMGLDPRIGPDFLQAGIGFGGFCFPKDLSAFIHIGEKVNVDLKILRAARAINDGQVFYFLERIRTRMANVSGATLAVLGLSFKPETDDLRYAPALPLIRSLADEGARIKTYDPVAMEKAKRLLPDQVIFSSSPYEAVKGADAIVLTTEWPVFLKLSFTRLRKLVRKPIVFDGRNAWPGPKLAQLGFHYVGVGHEIKPKKSRQKKKRGR